MREIFMKQLEELNKNLFRMGTMIQEAIQNAIEALRILDKEKAKEIIDADTLIDSKEKEIESACLHLLLQQSPVASDLRQVSAALKMVTDMERIGDHATDISEIVLLLDKIQNEEILGILMEMAKVTLDMVSGSLEAYVSRDVDMANRVVSMDDTVDRLFVSVKDAIAGKVDKDVEMRMQALDLLMIAKYFERIGDHAENIGEWVIFSITGVHKNERVI